MSDKIVASEYVALRARVIAELSRRNGNGDVSGQAEFEWNVAPVAGGYIYKEHPGKILEKLRIVQPEGLPEEIDDMITETDRALLNARLSAYELQPRSATSNNDCAALCTGMCVSQCTTSCGGSCTGSCSGGCSGGCFGCGGSCSYDCTSCTGTCTGDCTGTCSGTCSGSCSGGCSSSCRGGCKNSCGSVCTMSCAEGLAV